MAVVTVWASDNDAVLHQLSDDPADGTPEEQIAYLPFCRFQRIGQPDRQAWWINAGCVAILGQLHIELHMAHSITGHQQFEAVKAWQQVFLDIA